MKFYYVCSDHFCDEDYQISDWTCYKVVGPSKNMTMRLKPDAIPNYNLSFSSDLNQTSLKNINKKQITNLQAYFPDKSFKDIIGLNKIIYNLIKDDNIEAVYNILNNYSKDIKIVETFIKIDKSLPKITISQKHKKKFNLLSKE